MPRFRHPLTEFSAPAKARCEYWRTALGILSLLALLAGLTVVMRAGAAVALGENAGMSARELFSFSWHETVRPSSTTSFLIYVGTFACTWPALWLVLRVLHRRPMHTLWGPSGGINWTHYRIGLAVSLGMGAVAWLPFLHVLDLEALSLRQVSDWLPLLAIGLPLLFVQTAAEELTFRGYMLQQFAARSWTVIGWSIAPSLLFSALHHGEGQPLGLNWLSLVFGLVMAAVTSRTANLGAAAGMHFGHNIINTLLISGYATGVEPALIVLQPGVELRWPLMIFVLGMFLGAIIFMGRMDLKFLMEWRADPTKKGKQPIKLVLPIDEKWMRRREAREAERRGKTGWRRWV